MITLATLSEATAQEVFNQVATHLLTQNKKCIKDEICRYRFDRLKCAAGCLIADNEYEESFGGRSWSALVDDKYVPKAYEQLIIHLQKIHDIYNPSEWKGQLEKLATIYDLEFRGLS